MAAGNVRRADFAEHQSFSAGVYHLAQLFIQLGMRDDGGLLDEHYQLRSMRSMGERFLQNSQAIQKIAVCFWRVKDGEADVFPVDVIGDLPIGCCLRFVELAAVKRANRGANRSEDRRALFQSRGGINTQSNPWTTRRAMMSTTSSLALSSLVGILFSSLGYLAKNSLFGELLFGVVVEKPSLSAFKAFFGAEESFSPSFLYFPYFFIQIA